MATTLIASGVTSSALTISGNNVAVVQSGGTASSFVMVASQFATNGMSNQAGGTVVSALLSSGGNLYENGGVDRFTQILTGGFELVSSGGTASSVTMSGGTFHVAQGGTAVSATLLFNVIAVDYSGGTFSATTISSGAELLVSSGGVASGSKVLSGGLELALSGGSSIAADVTSGGTLVVSSGGSATGTTLENGGSLALRGVAFNASGGVNFDSSTSTLTVVEGANTYTEVLAGDYTGLFFHTTSGVNGSTLVTVNTSAACFCSGTLLMTEHGLVAVEDLTTDDRLLALLGDGPRRVRWIGHRRTRLSGHPRPWDVQPVRVAAGAFGPGLPTHALRLSPDHAVHVDGVLIPIKHLLNGATITQESIDRVTYYHVELAGPDDVAVHDVILAHGMPVESFLDTGNRSAFENGGAAIDVHPDFARLVWAASACATLVEGGPMLAATRARLLERAQAMGFDTTEDPGLRLVADGVVIAPAAGWDRTAYRFDVPQGTQTLRLVSDVFVPCHMVAGSNDARRLGVAVASVEIDGVGINLDDDTLVRGWHAAEPGLRWTVGDAELPCGADRVVEVRICVAGRYWATEAGRPDMALQRA